MKFRSIVLAVAMGLSLVGVTNVAFSDNNEYQLMLRAEAGEAEAAYKIGTMLLSGQGMSKDTDRGLIYLQRAAQKGHPYANTTLANYYSEQGNSPGNRARMYSYLRVAAKLGDTNAQAKLGRMLLDSTASGAVSPDQVEQYRAQAQGILEHAANHGNRIAMWELGQALFHGRGLQKNVNTGIDWMKKAADHGHGTAAYVVAREFFRVNNQETAATVALPWLIKAAENGHQPAMLDLAKIYEAGQLVSQDLPLAAQWAKKAGDSGVPGADAVIDRIQLAINNQIEHGENAAAQIAQQRDQLEQSVRSGQFEEGTDYEVAQVLGEDAGAMPSQNIAYSDQPMETDDYTGGQEVIAPAALNLSKSIPTDSAKLNTYVGQLRGQIVELTEENKSLRTKHAQALAQIARLDEEFKIIKQQLAQLRSTPATTRSTVKPQVALSMAPLPSKAKPTLTPNGVALAKAGMDAYNVKEFARARELFAASANQGNTEAMNNLATLYMRGAGTEIDIDRAIELYEKAAQLGYAPAAQNLAFIYQRGEGVKPSPTKASRWQKRADELSAPRTSLAQG